MSKTTIELKQREAVTLRFTVKDRYTLNAVDLSSVLGLTFTMKRSKHASTALITKETAAFGLTGATNLGVVSVSLNENELNLSPSLYYGELYMDIAANNKRKSQDLIFDLRQSIS